MARIIKGLCACGAQCMSKGAINGRIYYDRSCWKCKKQGYTRLKGPVCELCGFVPVHKSQLDVDHIDGNHQNNEQDNLQTLCANCHRLKTHLNKDHMPIIGISVMTTIAQEFWFGDDDDA